MPIRILIADDHGVLRAGLRSLLALEEDFKVVGEAASGEEALALSGYLQPDVVLMDISMGEMDGIEATGRLAEQLPTARVLLLTVHQDPALLHEAIAAGAAGYISKRAVESELINAIRAVAGGDLYVHPSMTRALLKDRSPESVEAPLIRLTPREREVLKRVAEGYTNRQIADLLHLSPRTVETHRANLKAKLHFKSRVELVRYAAGLGLLDQKPR
jgi:DNA-binding NarL/FixJ family response regulator